MIWLVTLLLGLWTLKLSIDAGELRRRAGVLEDLWRRERGVTRPDVAPSPQPVPAPPEPSIRPVQPPVAASAVVAPPSRPAPPPRPLPAPRPAGPGLGEILAEKGLAWLGGGALVLGGIFLVGYAAQQGLLTPIVRLAGAVLLAAVMLVASEMLRGRRLLARLQGEKPLRYPLAAAVVAGAGASTLYAVVWAAQSLYHYIPEAPAALLLLAVSGLLLALSTRHGQPLAVLAVAGGFAAPLIIGVGQWNEIALTAHLLVVGAAGMTVGAWRRWSWTALSAVLGAGTFGLHEPGHGESLRAAISALAFPAMALVYAARTHRQDAPNTGGPRDAVLPLALLLAAPSLVGTDALTAAAIAGLLSILTALAVRRRWTVAPVLVLPALFAVASSVWANLEGDAEGVAASALGLAQFAVLVGAGLHAAGRKEGARTAAVITTFAALLLIASVVLPIRTGSLSDHWASHHLLLCLASATLLAAAAVVATRRNPGAPNDGALTVWTLGAAACLAIPVLVNVEPALKPVAFAAMAVGFAGLQNRLAWRGLSLAAVIAGLFGAANLLRPDVFGPALTGGFVPVALALAAGALAALAGWLLKPTAPADPARQLLTAAAVGAGLTGGFLALRQAADASQGGITPLMEAGLRTLMFAMAGGSLVLALRRVKGVIAQVGPHLLLLAAALHAVCLQMLMLNPWWGAEPGATVGTLPLVNGLMIAFLAPAAVFGIAAARLAAREDQGQRAMAGFHATVSAVLAVTWAVLEIRRGFHPLAMDRGHAPYAEIMLYGLVALALPLLLRLIGRRVKGGALALSGAADAVSLVVLPGVLLVAVLAINPWWGLFQPAMGGLSTALLALAALVVAALLTLANRKGAPQVAREGGLVIAAAYLLAALTLAVRWAFHPADQGAAIALDARLGLETWTYSALWALSGAAILALGAARRERALRWTGLGLLLATGGKVLLFDMSALDGVARAASFLAVGALMVSAAVLARRLASKSPLPEGEGGTRAEGVGG